MSQKTRRQLIIFNSVIALADIVIFSNALLGLSLFAGSAVSISLAWVVVFVSIYVFYKGNLWILSKKGTRLLLQNINSLDSCISVFEEAIHNGDVFDENILQNISQIKRFRRKYDTIKDMLLQKFSVNEMSFQKFNGVLLDVEKVIYRNMRGILNKISAFDVDEYEAMQKKGFRPDEFSKEKIEIYNEYIEFVNKATKANEDILLKLDKMLLEVSRYSSLENTDVQKLPAIIEIDELIKHANLYNQEGK